MIDIIGCLFSLLSLIWVCYLIVRVTIDLTMYFFRKKKKVDK